MPNASKLFQNNSKNSRGIGLLNPTCFKVVSRKTPIQILEKADMTGPEDCHIRTFEPEPWDLVSISVPRGQPQVKPRPQTARLSLSLRLTKLVFNPHPSPRPHPRNPSSPAPPVCPPTRPGRPIAQTSAKESCLCMSHCFAMAITQFSQVACGTHSLQAARHRPTNPEPHQQHPTFCRGHCLRRPRHWEWGHPINLASKSSCPKQRMSVAGEAQNHWACDELHEPSVNRKACQNRATSTTPQRRMQRS